jgi:hypothetical protein
MRPETDVTRGSREFYTGTVGAFVGSTITGPLPWRPEAERALDTGRAPTMALRSSAAWAASTIRDATAIIALRVYSPLAPVPHDALHVYRVQLTPIHIGPAAVIDVLGERLEAAASSAAIEALIGEYWRPTGIWHLQEILAERLAILEEVPATPYRDVYLRRWVHYNLDRQRAASLSAQGS